MRARTTGQGYELVFGLLMTLFATLAVWTNTVGVKSASPKPPSVHDGYRDGYR